MKNIDMLIQQVRSDDYSHAEQAVAELAKSEDPRVIDVFTEILERNTGFDSGLAILQSSICRNVKDVKGNGKAGPALVKFIGSSFILGDDSFKALQKIKPLPLKELFKSLSSDSNRRKQNAITILGSSSENKEIIINTLLPMLDDNIPEIRLRCARAIAKLKQFIDIYNELNHYDFSKDIENNNPERSVRLKEIISEITGSTS